MQGKSFISNQFQLEIRRTTTTRIIELGSIDVQTVFDFDKFCTHLLFFAKLRANDSEQHIK